MRLVEAQYQDGVLRPAEPLSLRSGECVNLIVVRRADPRRWDLAKLAAVSREDDLYLATEGLAEWEEDLVSFERG